MFSYVWMKILELRPRSYDRRMDRASRGRVLKAKEAVAAEVGAGEHVLEIGCGTGELAAMLAARGATVEGFDLSESMVEVCRERIRNEELEGKFTVRQMGVEGMDGLKEGTFDAVMSTLVFSELSEDEQRFALRQAHRVLKRDGKVVIADEAVPRTAGRRVLHGIARAPAAALTFLVTRAGSRPLRDPASLVAQAGFEVEKEDRSHGDAFAVVVGVKKDKGRGP